MPIKRHVGIRSEANPFDPDWEIYFEKRLGVKMEQNLHGRRQLLYLWREQKGMCPICKQKITKLTGWHNHHIVWRSKGGSDKAENRVLLHPNCHRLVHSQGIFVEKPRPACQGVEEA
jgi:RNA-directed DNA polymerase